MDVPRPLRILYEYSADWSALSGQMPERFRKAIDNLAREAFAEGCEARHSMERGLPPMDPADIEAAFQEYWAHEMKLATNDIADAYRERNSG